MLFNNTQNDDDFHCFNDNIHDEMKHYEDGK